MRKLKQKKADSKKIKMTVTREILEKCAKLKKRKQGIKNFLSSRGFTNLEILAVEKALKGEDVKVKSVEEPLELDEWGGSLKFKEKYVYNSEDDKYVMYLQSANGNVVLSGDTVRGIKENYSNWLGKSHSINQVSRNYKIPRNYLLEILRILGITHDSEPITEEQLKTRNVKDVAAELVQKKKFQLHQQFQKESWKSTEEDAGKWRKMQEGVLDPFSNFISNWQPPVYEPIKQIARADSIAIKKSLLVGLSDTHFGAKSRQVESYRDKGYSSDEAATYIKNYAKEIKTIVENRSYGFDECVLAALGDILHTSGEGVTTKGTVLVHDCIKEEQFTIAFDSIVILVNSLLELFPAVRVKSVKGNHNDFGDWVLFKALEAYYRTEKRISFEVFQSDHGLFKVKTTLFVASHGYSAVYKGKLPSGGKPRESYIANLFLSKPEELIGVKQKVLLTADQHHLEMREYAEFEHYMLSTTVRGDKHSEAMGLNNTARQSCFVIDADGIKEMIYSYGR
jgi:hypothetical protein